VTGLRIALLTRRFDPSGGGTERDLMVTAACLREAGHEITIYADEVRGSSPGLTVRRIGGPRLGRALGLIRFGLGAAAAARRDGANLVVSFARAADADVLRSGGGAHASYVRAARRWRGAAGAAAMRISPYHRAQIFIERRAFASRRLKKVIAVSNFVRDDLVREFRLAPGIAVTLYNGVDLDRFRPARDLRIRDEVRDRLGIPRSAMLVIFVGNGFARKGLGYLIDAWPALGAKPHLLVVGSDRAEHAYRRRAGALGVGDRVIFAGPQPDVERLYQAADAFAMPSLFEPFGNTVMEAMASGLPVLSSAHSGVAEVLPPEMNPFIVEKPDDSGEIALRLAALLDAREGLGAIARAGAEKFTWERYARELRAIIEPLGRRA